MSNRREIVDFGSGALPGAKLTQILGATLSCVAKSQNYNDFKNCIIIPDASALPMLPAMSENGNGSMSAPMNGVNGSMNGNGTMNGPPVTLDSIGQAIGEFFNGSASGTVAGASGTTAGFRKNRN